MLTSDQYFAGFVRKPIKHQQAKQSHDAQDAVCWNRSPPSRSRQDHALLPSYTKHWEGKTLVMRQIGLPIDCVPQTRPYVQFLNVRFHKVESTEGSAALPKLLRLCVSCICHKRAWKFPRAWLADWLVILFLALIPKATSYPALPVFRIIRHL